METEDYLLKKLLQYTLAGDELAVADDSEGCHQMLYESKSAPLRSGAPNELSPKSTKSKLSMYRL
ncbi:MAG: hypothetical protein MR924_03770 [Prevotella sp.]|nr:hypothetical protein [Prevotella sp.]